MEISILKLLGQLELLQVKRCSEKYTFLKCQQILRKDYKSEPNLLEILEAHIGKFALQELQFITGIFKLICLILRNTSVKEDCREKCKNFKTQCILCYTIYITLYLQPLRRCIID